MEEEGCSIVLQCSMEFPFACKMQYQEDLGMREPSHRKDIAQLLRSVRRLCIQPWNG